MPAKKRQQHPSKGCSWDYSCPCGNDGLAAPSLQTAVAARYGLMMPDSTVSDPRGQAPAPRTGTLLRHKLAGAPRLWTSTLPLSTVDVCFQVLSFHPQPSGILAHLSRHVVLIRQMTSLDTGS